MIEPTVGRVVWFHAGGHETVMHSDQPLAAIVTYVHAQKHVDGKSWLINLVVFGKEGSCWQRQNVHLWDDDSTDAKPPARGSYAEWMPFQKGQAAKYEAEKAKNTPAPNDPPKAIDPPMTKAEARAAKAEADKA